jgi:hypothetical protein
VPPSGQAASGPEKPNPSARGYRRLTRRKAVSVDRSLHAETLRRPPETPLPAATTRRVSRYLSNHVARLGPVKGRRSLVESALPLRVEGDKGTKVPVRLALQRTPGGFRPEAPIVPLVISDRVPGRIEFPDIGLAAAPARAQTGSGPIVRDGRVFFANVQRDTDTVIAPTATGAETYSVLRSANSPEDVDLELSLPVGARLAPTPRLGGYQVVRGARPVAYIAPPVAWDADRRRVPVSAEIHGHTLRLHVSHRSGHAAYPILVDPAIVEDFRDWRGSASTDFRGWNYEADPSGKFTTFFGSSYLGNGLYMYNRTAQNYNDGDTRRWFFNVLGFGDAYIYRADFTNLYHEFNGTCLTEGIFSRTANAYEPGSPASQCAAITDYPSKVTCVNADCTPGGTTGNAAMFGIRTQGAGQRSTFTGYLGGAAIYETDNVKPVMANGGFPAGWVSSATGLTVRATDTGMGMEKVVLDSPAKPGWNQAQTRDFACAGDRNHRCPKIIEITFDTGDLPDGTVPVRATGTDVLGDTTTQTWYLKIDHVAPVVTSTSGTLWDHRDQDADHRDVGLYGADYTLHVDASDGGDSSGVKSIDIEVVNKATGAVERTDPDPLPQVCPTGGCGKSRDWNFHTDDYVDGQHLVRAVLTDQGNRQVTRDLLTGTVDRRGDIYEATEYDDTAPVAGEVAHEWAQAATLRSRRQATDEIVTRDNVSCNGSGPAQCGEVRYRTREEESDSSASDTYSAYRGSSTTDPNLDNPTDLLTIKGRTRGAPDGAGPIKDALDPSQYAPPAHGTTYSRYDTTSRNSAGDVRQVDRLWLDEATRLPLKDVATDAGGDVMYSVYWSYSVGRLDNTEAPADLFRVSPPQHQESSEDVTFTGTTAQGPQSDTETSTAYTPYFLGNQVSVSAQPFCFQSADIAHYRSGAVGNDGPDPEADLRLAQPITFSGAYYDLIPAGSGCTPAGPALEPSPPLQIRSMAGGSSYAGVLRDTYKATGQEIALDPTYDDAMGSGIQPITFGVMPTTAYVLPIDDGLHGAFVDLGSTAVTIRGPFSKSDLQQVVNALQAR